MNHFLKTESSTVEHWMLLVIILSRPLTSLFMGSIKILKRTIFLIISTITAGTVSVAEQWQSCTHLDTNDFGIYRIKNDMWRDHTGTCMWANSKDSWGADSDYPDGVYPWGYFNIFRGAHFSDVSNDPELPIKISDIASLHGTWHMKPIPAAGNRVWALWDLYAWKKEDRSDSGKGHWNILVFQNVVDHTQSWGTPSQIQSSEIYVGRFNIGGKWWHVQHSQTPPFSGLTGPATFFYAADDYSAKMTIDFKALIDWAVSEGYGNEDWYFGGWQAGWETVQGARGLETTLFSTELNGSVDGGGNLAASTPQSRHPD
jgi:hypothetical protein